MNSKQNLLMLSLTQFFKNKNNLEQMLQIVDEKSNVSLRILDWFVTNYAKKYNITYDNNGNKFMVYLDYKSQLKAYSKKQFDPFRRNDRISFYDYDNEEIETTVGQLNFFRWAISNGVLTYVKKNLNKIDEDMNTCLRNHYKKPSPINEKTQRRKRQELSVSATKTVNKHDVKIVVQFD